MSDKHHEPPTASDSPRKALSELRSTRDDFSRFFGDVFDQLQMLSLEMFARHKCLEAGVAATDGAIGVAAATNIAAEVQAEIEQCLDELRRTHETLKAQANGWQQTQVEFGSTRKQISDEFAEIQAIRRQVEEMAAQFAEIKADLRQNHEALAHLTGRMEHDVAPLLATLFHQIRNKPTAHGPPPHRMQVPADSAALGCVIEEGEFINQDMLCKHNGFGHRRE